ncbi:unnamed protein product [Dicrocoelium dendriticum]|nr:unnamed protein product [Dicrocoelium dendriticum]
MLTRDDIPRGCIIYTCDTVTLHPYHFTHFSAIGRCAPPDLTRRQIDLSPLASRRYRDDFRLISPPHSTSTKQSGSSSSEKQLPSRVSGRQTSFELKQ